MDELATRARDSGLADGEPATEARGDLAASLPVMLAGRAEPSTRPSIRTVARVMGWLEVELAGRRALLELQAPRLSNDAKPSDRIFQ